MRALRLGRTYRDSQGDRHGDRGIEVADLKVEVHHRALFPRRRAANGAW